MIKLDLKDRKTLYELNNNSRQPYSKIGKKTGMSKEVVQYRVNKLIENGVITSFYTKINSFKLGYNSIRFYLIFQNTTDEIQKELIDYFGNNNKYVFNCASIEGRYDLVVNMWIQDLNKFYEFWEEGLSKYRDCIQQEIFSIYIEWIEYRFSYLLQDKYKKSDRKKIDVISTTQKKIEIDDLDWKILKLISLNARMPLVKIAKKLNSSINIIRYRINKLQKQKIITGFRIGINLEKIGYQRFKVDIYLSNYSKKYQILNYIKQNPHLTWVSKSIGISDLELEFDVENITHLHEILKDLKSKFPQIIRNYRYFNILERHKFTLMPQK